MAAADDAFDDAVRGFVSSPPVSGDCRSRGDSGLSGEVGGGEGVGDITVQGNDPASERTPQGAPFVENGLGGWTVTPVFGLPGSSGAADHESSRTSPLQSLSSCSRYCFEASEVYLFFRS